MPSGIPDFRSPGHRAVGQRRPDGGRAHRRLPPRPRALLAVLRRSLPDARAQAPEPCPRGARGARAGRHARRRDHAEHRSAARSAPARATLVEVHGTIAHSSCLRCARALRAGRRARPAGRSTTRRVPRCDCGEPLKPDVVLFGEYLPEDALARAEQLAAGADLLLCIGTSLEVYPVAELPRHDARRGRQDRDPHPGSDAVRPPRERCAAAVTSSTSSRPSWARSGFELNASAMTDHRFRVEVDQDRAGAATVTSPATSTWRASRPLERARDRRWPAARVGS